MRKFLQHGINLNKIKLKRKLMKNTLKQFQ